MLEHMKQLGLILPLVLGFAVPLAAQLANATSEENSNSVCATCLKMPLPAEASTVHAPKAWPDCDSYRSYSGIGREVNLAQARKCAWSERLAQQAGIEPRYNVASLFGGSAMLAVLYANGEGVEQNKTLAYRFACESGLEGDGKTEILALPNVPHITGKKFAYCDSAFTTFEMNFCAAYAAEIAAQKRQDALDQISSRWPRADQDAFRALESAEEEYVNTHGAGETYLGGTIRNLRVNGVEERQRDIFLAAVWEFENGHQPKGTEADYRKADSDLNATYREALELAGKQKFEEDDGSIRPEGIQKAERAWLKYRDAWAVFAKLHYSHTDPNAWLNLPTRNRYWSLRMTLCDVGWDDAACKSVELDD